MPNVYVIMGDRNARKSATIRALTGAFQKDVYQVAIQDTRIINVFVHISSLQESQISPQQFIHQIGQNDYQYVLVSLWISQGNRQPNGSVYIQNFLNARWNILQIVVLGTNHLPYGLSPNIPHPKHIPNSQGLPANQIASQIREWWQWL